MGRKRVKHNLKDAISSAEALHHLNVKDEDGLYPFSPSWVWRPKAGKGRGSEVRLTIDVALATVQGRRPEAGELHRHFYSEFRDVYPWAVEVLGRALKSSILDSRNSVHEASYKRGAIGNFLSFCKDTGVKLFGPQDLSYKLMCNWRAHLRLSPMDSRYKSTMFRRVGSVIEKIMGTSLMPQSFTMPIYSSDSPDHLPAYSDAVMYQLIGACVSDIQRVMDNAKEFTDFKEKFGKGGEYGGVGPNWRLIITAYLDCFSFRNDGPAYQYCGVEAVKQFSAFTSRISEKYPSTRREFARRFPPLDGRGLKTNYYHRVLAEREVPSQTSIFPFLLFFLIFSGKNKEVVQTWKRVYRFDGFEVSPLDWRDPLDPRRCRLRGWKNRKGPFGSEADDTYVSIEEQGIYPVLEFLLWYTAPLVDAVEGDMKDSLWLFYDWKGASDLYVKDGFFLQVKKFLSRHAIWDVNVDENGSVTKERLRSLDSRCFRKVHASHELLKALGTSQNYQELHERLVHAFSHKSFDTTLGSYLSVGAPRAVVDIGIFTLQTQYVEAARKFRGVRVEKGEITGVPGFYTACADPLSPDFEGAGKDGGPGCRDYDMCLGCSKSRVFDIHLPRISARVIQYESLKDNMKPDQWESQFGRKHARAQDVLAGWSDQEEVDAAWAVAKSGAVKLPLIIAKG